MSKNSPENGLTERMNETILERVRCMFFFGLPKSFWVEVVSTTYYLISRSPSTIGLKTPMEMWLGHPTNYENLKNFGCVAYTNVKQGKLEPRAKKCIFLGVS